MGQATLPHKQYIIALGLLCFTTLPSHAEEKISSHCNPIKKTDQSVTRLSVANQLGWIPSADHRCGGYYLEAPFTEINHSDAIKVTGNQGVFSLHGTSIYEGKVTITHHEQELVTNKAYLYRDPVTENFSGIELVGNVALREPNSLILARCGQVDLEEKNKLLRDILYRTTIYRSGAPKSAPVSTTEYRHARKIAQLSAWGKADTFTQNDPNIYHFSAASYSTCSPTNPAWQVEASDITLDKNSGRGTAKHARFKLKGIPVLYAPYLNFPIDSRRQTGFLWPTVGSSSTSGATITAPFYWNIAPNYDDTITPAILWKRGFQINNLFRYLTETTHSYGEFELTLLPDDQLFETFKQAKEEAFQNASDPSVQSQLHRLLNDSTTRWAISWQNTSRFNDHWTANVDYNLVSDDYYLRDFSNGLNEVTPNQLLQEGDINYKGQYWNFTGRLQGYQTLHPIDQNPFFNQYIRLPQLILDGAYPDEKTGLTYFIGNDVTHFNIEKNPGNLNPGGVEKLPIGNRINVQPGISLPVYRPSYYINPRLQFALTDYQVSNVPDDNSKNPSRALPIFDVNSGLMFERNVTLFNRAMKQTLEPKIYYTYVPYRNQDQLPVFDTTVNTLTYDQLFTYNRFSGLDRIGDANQISVGVTTRFIDPTSGYEKISAGIGQIFYFENRRVTLCSNADICLDYPGAPENNNSRSPLSGVLNYRATPYWNATAYTIWDSQENQLTNQTVTLQYLRDLQHVINLSYSYVLNGDNPQNTQISADVGSSSYNLSQTDLSFTWPITNDWSTIGRWTENWNRSRFQNLLYGLQYDTCCWALRIVGGRTFNSLTANNTYQYNTEFYLQFVLKGLGSFGTGNPGRILNNASIANQPNFGQDF